jgi:hypothetical protein
MDLGEKRKAGLSPLLPDLEEAHYRTVLVSSQPDLFVVFTLVKAPKAITAECPNRPVAIASTERALDERVRFYCRIYF